MTFRVARHATASPPAHALELLSARIPARREDVLFSTAAGGISARLDRDESVWMTQDERAEIGRRAILDAVGDVCERDPELKLEWYAIVPAR